MTTAELEPKVNKSKRVKKTQAEIEQFVKDTIKRLPETQVIIKPITDHWFRINYIKSELLTPDSVIHNNIIVESSIVEVIESADGLTLIDQTINK